MLIYDDIRFKLNNVKPKLEELREALDLDRGMQEAAALEEKTSAADFWNEPENSQKVLQRIKQLKDKNARYQRLHGMYEDVVTTIEMAEEMQDESLFPEVQSGFDAFMAELDSQTLSTLLTGEYDKNNAIMASSVSCTWSRSLVLSFWKPTPYCSLLSGVASLTKPVRFLSW